MLPYINIEMHVRFLEEKSYKFLNQLRNLNTFPIVIIDGGRLLINNKKDQYEKFNEYIKDLPKEQQPVLKIKLLPYRYISGDIIAKAESLGDLYCKVTKFSYDNEPKEEGKLDKNSSLKNIKGVRVEKLEIDEFSLRDFINNEIITFPQFVCEHLKDLTINIRSLLTDKF